MRLYWMVGKFLGLYPTTDFSHKGTKIFVKFYMVIVLGILMVTNVYNSAVKYFWELDLLTTFEKVINFVALLNPPFLFLTILVTNLLMPDSWKTLFELFSIFDSNCGYWILEENKYHKGLVQFMIMQIGVLIYTVCDLILCFHIHQYEVSILVFVPQHITYFYAYNVAFFVMELSVVLDTRYLFLQEDLKLLILCKNERGSPNDDFEAKIKNVKKLYKILYNIIETTNKLFGFWILVILVHFEVMLVRQFYFLIQPSRTFYIILQRAVVHPLCLLVSQLLQKTHI